MARSFLLPVGLLSAALCLGGFGLISACSSDRESFTSTDAGDASSSGLDGGFNPDVGDAGPQVLGETRDPIDCEEAKSTKSYVGCDYWPTVTPNMVWSIFDYALVVANTGANDATVTVTGPNGVNKQVTVPANQLQKIYLPWVPALKGADIDNCSSQIPRLDGSLIVPEGAYHLVSSSPVIVYQFNALEYKGEGGEGPDGGPKDWSTCPAFSCATGLQCLSFTNDASLLLPSTAMTTNYRVTAYPGYPGGFTGTSTALSITATQPNTTLKITLSKSVSVMATPAPPAPDPDAGADGGTDAGTAGPTVPAGGASTIMTIALTNAGDVLELVADRSKDFSGTLVQSDQPVQVLTSDPCISIPFGKKACDHIEETVMPAETLGKHYVVPPPTGPAGTPVGQIVRIYGNQNNTKLTYVPTKPSGCPLTLDAGDVFDCGVVDYAFEVTADKEFGIATFLLGSSQYNDDMGDPSESIVASVEQFRTKYIFLAPNDYPVQWADITAPQDAEVVFDGQPIAAPWNQVGTGTYGVYRVDLTKSGQNGAHTLTSKKAIGVQVIGFGLATSFQYPAGLNLNLIAPPPPK